MAKGITKKSDDYSQWYNDIVLKADFQWIKTDLNSEIDKGFNLGIGYMF